MGHICSPRPPRLSERSRFLMRRLYLGILLLAGALTRPGR
jgi:hypothetical protein